MFGFFLTLPLLNTAPVQEPLAVDAAALERVDLASPADHGGFFSFAFDPKGKRLVGGTGLVPPLKTSWRDHEGGVGVLIQQWDGSNWIKVSDWIDPYREFVKDMIMKSAAKYAKEKGIKRRMKPSDGI